MDDGLTTRREIRVRNLGVRLARSDADIRAAQELRYRVFYCEMAAHPSAAVSAAGRDMDRFDAIADHLLVIDHDLGQGPQSVVGTYRLLRRSIADQHGGFYSVDEYDIAPLLRQSGEILELGRSCVAAPYRTRPTMQLLWRGIASYVFANDITLMFGCASLPGTAIEPLAGHLSYLYHYHLAPPALRPRALDQRYLDMRQMPAEAINARRAMAELPPLIKGYLRLGGFVGDGAVIDWDFNTTDVCVVVKTDLIAEKYARHYNRVARDGDQTPMGAIYH